MIFLGPHAVVESSTLKLVCNFAPILVYDVFRSAIDFADSYHCCNWTTCTRGYFTPEIYSSDPDVSEIRPSFELKFFSYLFWTVHKNITTLCGCLGIFRPCSIFSTAGMDKASGHPLQQTNSAPLFQSRWCHHYSVRHHLRQQIQADGLPFASTPALGSDILLLARTLWGSG